MALDICGFSKDPKLQTLLRHRNNLFFAVNEAPHVGELVEAKQVKIQFVGDELRFGFLASIDECGEKIVEFVEETLKALSKTETRIKGAMLAGELKWRRYRGCDFFDGPLAVMCSDWLSSVNETQVIANEEFLDYATGERIPLDVEKVETYSASGYILKF